jgi:hypothetical protein
VPLQVVRELAPAEEFRGQGTSSGRWFFISVPGIRTQAVPRSMNSVRPRPQARQVGQADRLQGQERGEQSVAVPPRSGAGGALVHAPGDEVQAGLKQRSVPTICGALSRRGHAAATSRLAASRSQRRSDPGCMTRKASCRPRMYVATVVAPDAPAGIPDSP